MTGTVRFALQWSPWLCVVAGVLVLLCLTASVLTCCRSRWRPGVVVTELLRVVVIGGVVLTLLQPEWRAEVAPQEKPILTVLEDRSGSMDTEDMGGEGSRASRRKAVESMKQDPAWEALSATFAIKWQAFAEPAGGGTDLHQALEAARASRPDVVVILSDGDWNEGESPLRTLPEYQARGTQVSAVPLGRPEELPDLAIAQWALPVRVGIEEDVRIPVLLRNRFPDPVPSVLRFAVNGLEVEERSVTLAPGVDQEETFFWKEEEAGDYDVRITLEAVPGEASTTNNERAGVLQVSDQRRKVLIVESVPRWEYRFLRNALLRDPGVEVDCLLMHPGEGMVRPRGPGYLETFPASLGALGTYDVVFLGDVGMGEGELQQEELDRIRTLVEEQASGLVFLPGPRGAWLRLLESALGALLPVWLDEGTPSGIGRPLPAALELTATARSSPLTMLAESPEANRAVWERLPGFYWHAPVTGVKVGGQVLAVHEAERRESGRLPLLVTRRAGRGKVLFMGTDGAWRWRRGVEDRYHYRFWSQVVRWMAYQRKMAEGRRARLIFSPERPVEGEPVVVTAAVVGDDQGPFDADAIVLKARAEGREESWVLDSEETEWGTFTGSIRFSAGGDYMLGLETAEGVAIDYASELTVASKPWEGRGEPARPEVLEALARATGGIVVAPYALGSLEAHLAELPRPPAREVIVAWWNHPAWAGALVVLLGIYWLMRKRLALV